MLVVRPERSLVERSGASDHEMKELVVRKTFSGGYISLELVRLAIGFVGSDCGVVRVSVTSFPELGIDQKAIPESL